MFIEILYFLFENVVFYIGNLIPPGDEFADVHERVKYFCGVTNEELLEKLRYILEKFFSFYKVFYKNSTKFLYQANSFFPPLGFFITPFPSYLYCFF